MARTIQTAPERLYRWCKRQFSESRAQAVFYDLLDVATGTREGNPWEREALAKVFPHAKDGRLATVQLLGEDGKYLADLTCETASELDDYLAELRGAAEREAQGKPE